MTSDDVDSQFYFSVIRFLVGTNIGKNYINIELLMNKKWIHEFNFTNGNWFKET